MFTCLLFCRHVLLGDFYFFCLTPTRALTLLFAETEALQYLIYDYHLQQLRLSWWWVMPFSNLLRNLLFYERHFLVEYFLQRILLLSSVLNVLQTSSRRSFDQELLIAMCWDLEIFVFWKQVYKKMLSVMVHEQKKLYIGESCFSGSRGWVEFVICGASQVLLFYSIRSCYVCVYI